MQVPLMWPMLVVTVNSLPRPHFKKLLEISLEKKRPQKFFKLDWKSALKIGCLKLGCLK